MPALQLERFGLAVAALVLTVSLVSAALPKPTLSPDNGSLAGQLLIASTALGDPRFRRTVILMVRHGKTGAFGIVINRPIDERPLSKLLEMLGEKDATAEGSTRIFAGGPVQPEAGFVVHTTDYAQPGTIHIGGELAVTASPQIVRDIAGKKGPQKALVAFGYAGWASGQLEAELARNDWLTTPADQALVFDEARERVWDEAMARQKRSP
jgi:putative transcriptional regulator